ncbi:MAG: NADPH-dependent FMN reductase [Prochlorotrichaceae cyanobacterium]|jgi:NAD(P)H-dependent FMN reductase
MANIAIISGSQRDSGNSHRVAKLTANLISSTGEPGQHHGTIVNIQDLPLWDEGLWGKSPLNEKWSRWEPISQTLTDSDGIVIITPEYAGMASPLIANFLLIAGHKEVGHKPGLLISVSASRGGAYPIAQLRSFSTKNNSLCWIPDHVIVRDVDEFFTEINSGKENYTSRKLSYSLKLLMTYAEALVEVRNSGNIDYETFPYGM